MSTPATPALDAEDTYDLYKAITQLPKQSTPGCLRRAYEGDISFYFLVAGNIILSGLITWILPTYGMNLPDGVNELTNSSGVALSDAEKLTTLISGYAMCFVAHSLILRFNMRSQHDQALYLAAAFYSAWLFFDTAAAHFDLMPLVCDWGVPGLLLSVLTSVISNTTLNFMFVAEGARATLEFFSRVLTGQNWRAKSSNLWTQSRPGFTLLVLSTAIPNTILAYNEPSFFVLLRLAVCVITLVNSAAQNLPSAHAIINLYKSAKYQLKPVKKWFQNIAYYASLSFLPGQDYGFLPNQEEQTRSENEDLRHEVFEQLRMRSLVLQKLVNSNATWLIDDLNSTDVGDKSKHRFILKLLIDNQALDLKHGWHQAYKIGTGLGITLLLQIINIIADLGYWYTTGNGLSGSTSITPLFCLASLGSVPFIVLTGLLTYWLGEKAQNTLITGMPGYIRADPIRSIGLMIAFFVGAAFSAAMTFKLNRDFFKAVGWDNWLDNSSRAGQFNCFCVIVAASLFNGFALFEAVRLYEKHLLEQEIKIKGYGHASAEAKQQQATDLIGDFIGSLKSKSDSELLTAVANPDDMERQQGSISTDFSHLKNHMTLWRSRKSSGTNRGNLVIPRLNHTA